MHILSQLGILFAVCLAGEWLGTLLPFPFPGSVLAMILLLVLLLTGLLPVKAVEDVADFLLRNMGVLFIPAGAGILNSADLLRGHVFQVLLICVVTTVLVFAVTAWTVSGVAALQQRLKGRRDNG